MAGFLSQRQSQVGATDPVGPFIEKSANLWLVCVKEIKQGGQGDHQTEVALMPWWPMQPKPKPSQSVYWNLRK